MYNSPKSLPSILACSIATVLLAGMSATGRAENVFWDGGAGTSNWSDAANWSNDLVPTSSDTVFLLTNQAVLPTNMDLVDGQVDNVFLLGTSDLSISGNSLTLDRIASRHSRSVTFASGDTTITVTDALGVTGLAVGMVFNGSGIPNNTTITAIDPIANTFTISAAPTSNQATPGNRNFDAAANLVWNNNLVVNAAESWNVASGRTITINGNMSGPGGINGNVDSELILRGTNTHSGPTYTNVGTIRLMEQKNISPNSTLGSAFGFLRFSSDSSEFRYLVPNTIETGQGNSGYAVDGGGRVEFTGSWMERGNGVRGINLTRTGSSGVATYLLNGSIDFDGRISVGPNTLVRLASAPIQAQSGTDNSTIDGTLDLMGNDFDRRVTFNNIGGAANAGNLVNSVLNKPSTLSGAFASLGTNLGNAEFGGPGVLIVTGDISLATSTSSTGTGYNKQGPGAAIIRSASFTDPNPGSANNHEVLNGTLVLDHSVSNVAKITADQLSLANGRFVVVGNNSAATNVTIGNLNISNASDRGYAEVEVRSGTGANASLTFANLTNISDTEALNFQVVNGGGGVPEINTTAPDGVLGGNVTFNRSQWAEVAGGKVVGRNPSLVAADSTAFESSTGNTEDIGVTGSYSVFFPTIARTLRFAEAGATTLTLGAGVELNRDSANGSGILIAPGTGPVVIDSVSGTEALVIGNNSSLTVHHHGSNPLTISARINGGSGTELNKVGSGELILENITNSYNGSTIIYEGTLTTSSITDSGFDSTLGTSSLIQMGSKNSIDLTTGVATQNPARLRYTGIGDASNRTFQLMGVSEIQVNGTGLLDFTATGDVVTQLGNTGNWNDLILSGSGQGRFNGALNLGHGNLVKREAGTWTLESTSSVTTFGDVSVEAGTLVLNGTIGNSATARVLGNGKLIGTGTTADLRVAAGGVVEPGNGYGVLKVRGDFTMEAAASKLAFELRKSTPGGRPVAGSDYDQLDVFGTNLGTGSDGTAKVTLNGELQLTLGTGIEANDMFFLIINDGIDAISGTFAGLADGASIVQGGQEFRISYNANWTGDAATSAFTGGNDVALMAIPEPGTVSALAGGLGMLLSLGRFRRRNAAR